MLPTLTSNPCSRTHRFDTSARRATRKQNLSYSPAELIDKPYCNNAGRAPSNLIPRHSRAGISSLWPRLPCKLAFDLFYVSNRDLCSRSRREERRNVLLPYGELPRWGSHLPLPGTLLELFVHGLWRRRGMLASTCMAPLPFAARTGPRVGLFLWARLIACGEKTSIIDALLCLCPCDSD